MSTLDEEIERYLLSGDCDGVACVGVGGLRAHGRTYAAALREALIDEVRDRSAGTPLASPPWPHAAWSLANLYLESLGRKPLGPDDSRLVGLGEELQCFVSPVYFAMDDRFADYVVHELARVFHNCKREIFAYACEAYGRILELADRPPARANLLDEHARGPLPSREEVDRAEYFDILREAVQARNGWKRIYERCRRSRPPRRVSGLTMDGRND